MRTETATALLFREVQCQHGVIGRAQLVALGFGRRRIEAYRRAGTLRQLHRGVYAVGPMPPTWHGHALAATLACGEGTVLSHRAAAGLHDLVPRSSASPGDVTVPSPSGRRSRPGLRIHRSHLPAVEVTEVDGIPVTTVARTLIDLAEVAQPREAERALERAEQLRVFDLTDLRDTTTRHPGRTGSARVNKAVAAYTEDDTFTRSTLERRFLAACRSRGLPEPLVNTWLEDMEVDFLWPDQRLVVEMDGWGTHGTRKGFERDRARDAELALRSYRVLRFTWRQVGADPEQVAEIVKAVLEAT